MALLGAELKWQPWCQEVGGEGWKSYPLRWGANGQLFSILQHVESGQIKLAVVDETKPMEEWAVIVAPPREMFSAQYCKFKPFNLKQESYVACVDKFYKKMIMYKILDPSAPWVRAYDEPLNDLANPKSMPFTEMAKINIIYCPKTRHPYAIIKDGPMSTAVLYRIDSEEQPWVKIRDLDMLPETRYRMWPVSLRTDNQKVWISKEGETLEVDPATGLPHDKEAKDAATELCKMELFLFVVDVDQKELNIFYIPREGAEKEWVCVWRKSMIFDM